MKYEAHILRILTEAGPQGVSLRKLALNVYNLNASFFDTPDFEAVYRHVQQYLARNSLARNSLVERTGQWGRYRLNLRHSPQARQLMLEFGAGAAPTDGGSTDAVEEQQPLSLFDAEWASAPPKHANPNEPLDLFGDL